MSKIILISIGLLLFPYLVLSSCNSCISEEAGHSNRMQTYASACDSSISPVDSSTLQAFFSFAREKQLAREPLNRRIIAIGLYFLGKPYRGGTLDIHSEEQLVVNLQEFDCVTFVDNVLALALVQNYDTAAPQTFRENLQRLRYRNGKIMDYTSRLHYSTDWLHEMTEARILADVTPVNGGLRFTPEVNFISKNYSKYPPLVKDTALVTRMRQIERDINSRHQYYIPKERVYSERGMLQPGDIVLITTNKKGLDTAHVGIAIEKEGKIYLLHASISEKKVVVSESPLQNYLQQIRSHTGIIIGRPYYN